MEFPVRQTLDELGVRAVAEAAGIPFWTMRKWRDANKIPGTGINHQWRLQVFKEAVAKCRADAKPKQRKRKVAA